MRILNTLKRQAAWMCCLALAIGSAEALTLDEINKAGPPVPGRSKVTRPTSSIVKAQVLLARQGISPGEIDGIDGENYRKAVANFRSRAKLGSGDVMDAATWQALLEASSSDIITKYSITEEDARYSYVRRIPHDYARQARMKRLAYKKPVEMFAERFHMSEKLFIALNPDARLRRRGETLYVVASDRTRPTDEVTLIQADKTRGTLSALDATGKVIASYPATIGSEDTPSPEGEHQVVRVVKNPTYHYDPAKNFQQGKNKRRLVLPKGPNNPVGTIWIELSKPTFGIHGTPEPSRISKASSHGCIRLTNWDAEELAQMVKPGTLVRFVD
ncbi:L,D-transpeptidase family protein [Bosea rubneri]|uniref:L,D-transpeptidase n=1 Tax=Bosea rubneri TaxID=3075434 RepID=A0ABU3SGI6_9HYPH|nr:L,D-transpeptidase [Bosea sp. ZW T0_25]MDU0343910.1 L,D-transpeptidase [Bosea sp. ZW T0_25]